MDNIEKIKKLKTKTLVQTKKAEYWIRDTKEDSYNDLVKDFDYKPSMGIEEGVKNFVDWYKEYKKNG